MSDRRRSTRLTSPVTWGWSDWCIALHLVFDFSKDRLIWDTGHQIYPHKLVTGRYPDFRSDQGGLMGYPDEESDFTTSL
ncbi:MAG: 1-deoxy-D-xylulose-5-phosphate synthase N-terminal domain-containing protein [Planctomycetaceae bacterium]